MNQDIPKLGCQLTPTQKYLEGKQRLDETIRYLREIGGNLLECNPYKDTIIRLEGRRDGMTTCEYAVDM